MPERVDCSARRFPESEELRHALGAGVLADFAVELWAVLAHLAHVAEHQRRGRGT
jgi:hypothetical protein